MNQSSFQRLSGIIRAAGASREGKYCPGCDGELKAKDINISEGVALCPVCGELSPLSAVVHHNPKEEQILDEPPAGCHVEEFGDRIIVRASMRSLAGVLGGLAMAAFWNGIVSVFVLIALAGLYTNLVGPLPHWFPAPTSSSGGQMGLGMTIFMCIFLIPFVTIGLGMIGYILLAAMGSYTVIITPDRAEVRTGIGPLAWPRRFDPNSVSKVGVKTKRDSESGSVSESILIQADREIDFGSMLPDHRQKWMRVILRKLLVQAVSRKVAAPKRIID
ncbi:MAG: hypothetical protein JJU36_18280 [Phycisphaeraceae bacterium]|nr:hypothetical protein [Phycisphaeraceae bacterium]